MSLKVVLKQNQTLRWGGPEVSRRNAMLTALLLFPYAPRLAAQESGSTPQAAPTFSSNVKVVNVLATVTDKKGNLVRDLTKEDFALEEDGRPQVIRYFSQQSAQPLTVGLLVDTSGSERRMIPTEKDASYTFLEQVLRPDKDKAFLIHFDREVELLQDLTSSRESLEKALNQLNRPEWGQGAGNGGSSGSNGGGSGGNGGYGGGRGGYGGGRRGGTALYDAIYLAADDVLKKQTGRKAIILLTDGEDNGSKILLPEAITTAQRSDTLVYSIRIADEELGSMNGFGYPGMGRHGGYGGMGRGGGNGPWGGGNANRPDGKKVLKQISRETGGGYFEVSKKNTVEEIYGRIQEQLRNQYSLGYTPEGAQGDTGYHKIALTVKNKKDLVVQARDGYYAGA